MTGRTFIEDRSKWNEEINMMGPIKRFKMKRRLKKILKATEQKITKEQRTLILSPYIPYELAQWGRGSGKTLVACLWTLLWRDPDNPIDYKLEARFVTYENFVYPVVPDPDIKNITTLKHTMRTFMWMANKCRAKGIPVCRVINVIRG